MKNQKDKIDFIDWNFRELKEYLDDSNINEIAVNDSGEVWVATFDRGWIDTSKRMEKQNILSLMQVVADYREIIVDEENPILETEFYDGSRFSGTIDPISSPSFNLRKHSTLVFTLDNYIKQKNITIEQKKIIQEYIINKKNILVVGATGSGKTTFANACIEEISSIEDRVVIVEDTREIQCKVKNNLRLISSKLNPMVTILQHCMRRTPERLIVGEVRGKEALYLLTAWNSGHGGGVCTIHSESASKGLRQLEQYIMLESVNPQREMIADNIHLIVVLQKIKGKRKIVEIKKMVGLENDKYILEDLTKGL